MPQPPWLRILGHWLRRLDFLPPWGAWVIGLGCGALGGAALVGGVPGAAGVLGFLTVLFAAAGLAASGEPIAVVDQASPPIAYSLVDLVEIPGGSFLMGNPESEERLYVDEGPVHQVRLSSFACMRLPVTRRLYAEILGQDPSWPDGDTDDRPVNSVSWFDAVKFCNRLSKREGLTPCYQITDEAVSWQHVADGYRLLTEAEWEYACRAGTKTRWSFGNDEKRLSDHAWFNENSNYQPQPVGRKLPNAWGLHDMHGSVREWCWDWLGRYSAQPQHNPRGPDEGTERIMRGGAFGDSPEDLRSAVRGKARPSVLFRGIGFRCARNLRRQP